MNVRQTLENITTDILSRHEGVFLVEVNQKQDHYEFVLDGDKAIGIYDISSLAREINKAADEQMADATYSLDVTSPGADSPLKLLRQYPKHIGREFLVNMKDGNSFKGKLKGIEGLQLNFEMKNDKPKKNQVPELVTIEFNQIKQANIILSFK